MIRPLLLLSCLLPLCALAGERYGEPLPAGEAVPLSRVADQATEQPGEPIKVSGRVTEVCRNKGCWVILEDDGRSARVMAREHAFAVPGDARGAAVVYGRLSLKHLDEGTASHLAEDAGQTAPVARDEVRIEALGIEFVDG